MELDNQGVNAVQTSNVPIEGQGGTAAPSADVNVQQIQEPSAIPQGQGAPPQSDADKYREIQSLADRRQAENFQLQQQLLQTQQQMNEVIARLNQPAQPQTNPYDAQAQPNEWWNWTMQQNNRSLINEMREINRSDLMNLVQTASEQSWLQQHPDVDLRTLKTQIQARYGITNPSLTMIDDFHRVMSEPNRIQSAATNAINQTFQQMRQTTQIPSTVRGGVGGGAQVAQQGNYEEDAKAYVGTNGRIYNTWSLERQKAFDRETANRDFAQRQAKAG